MARLPLAALIWRSPRDRRYTLTIAGLAALTDILDGRAARRTPTSSHPSGVWLDPLCDKAFVLSALGAITLSRRPHPLIPVLIASRELAQLPLAIIYFSKFTEARRFAPVTLKAAPIGKLATVVQFLAIASLSLRSRYTSRLALAAGLIGPLATLYYFRRAMIELRRESLRRQAARAQRRAFDSYPKWASAG